MAPFEKIAIPQQPPMVMIDRLVEVGDGRVVTTFFIRSDNVLCQNGRFTEAGLIENMAQTAAAGAGIRYTAEGVTPPVGFIGGIRDLTIHEYPEAGQEILTEIVVEHEVLNASVVRGKILLNHKPIASCQIKIFLQTQP